MSDPVASSVEAAPSAFVTVVSKAAGNVEAAAATATSLAAAAAETAINTASNTGKSLFQPILDLPKTTQIAILAVVSTILVILIAWLVLWLVQRSEQKADRRRELDLPMRSPVVTFDEGASWTNASSRTIAGPWERKKSWVYRGDD